MRRITAFLMFLLLSFLFSLPLISALPPLPVKGLSSAERNTLAAGKPIIRQLASVKEASLDAKTAASREMLELFQDVNPNFIAEAIFVLPLEPGTEDAVLSEALSVLRDIPVFDTIPYYSKQNDDTKMLFVNTRVKKRPAYSPTRDGILADQEMLPFKPADMIYTYESFPKEKEWLFRSENVDPLYYRFMRAVKPGGMNTALLIEKHPGALVFYGLGGARAFNFFGIFGDRLDVAFIGRIEAFFGWFHTNFVIPRLHG
jgi:hypothetical protein